MTAIERQVRATLTFVRITFSSNLCGDRLFIRASARDFHDEFRGRHIIDRQYTHTHTYWRRSNVRCISARVCLRNENAVNPFGTGFTEKKNPRNSVRNHRRGALLSRSLVYRRHAQSVRAVSRRACDPAR